MYESVVFVCIQSVLVSCPSPYLYGVHVFSLMWFCTIIKFHCFGWHYLSLFSWHNAQCTRWSEFFSFLLFSCPFLVANLTVCIPVIAGVLFVFVVFSLLHTAFTDPGILPRALPDEAADIERQIGKSYRLVAVRAGRGGASWGDRRGGWLTDCLAICVPKV